jgi:hypothetical protein
LILPLAGVGEDNKSSDLPILPQLASNLLRGVLISTENVLQQRSHHDLKAELVFLGSRLDRFLHQPLESLDPTQLLDQLFVLLILDVLHHHPFQLDDSLVNSLQFLVAVL